VRRLERVKHAVGKLGDDQVWLKVTGQPDGPLYLTWGNRKGPYDLTYQIEPTMLARAACQIRTALQPLIPWSVLRDRTTLPQILNNIEEAGANLRSVLFKPHDRRDGDDVRRLTRWIDQQRAGGDSELSVIAPNDVHVPWGLAFDDSANVAPPGSRFWCEKFQFSVVLSGCEARELYDPRPRDSFRLVSLLNRELYNEAESDLGTDNFHELETILQGPCEKVFTYDACLRTALQVPNSDKIFYFYGHGEKEHLVLGNGEKIDMFRFERLVEKLTAGDFREDTIPYTLIFLNACDSACGDADFSFQSVATQPGVCGIILTEAYVPRKFAIDFARRVLLAFIRNGVPVGDAVRSAANNVWPLGLVYSCYANPNFRLATEQ